MKKVIIACACVLALGMTSCKDTQACYELTVDASIAKASVYVWCTANELDTYIMDTAKKYGVDKSVIKYKRTTKSQNDCVGGGINF